MDDVWRSPPLLVGDGDLLASQPMDAKTIAAVLAGLAGTTITLGCDRTPDATEVPGGKGAERDTAGAAGEHACGNHAEGACGAGKSADADPAVATSRSFDVAPGKFAEANFQMKKGSTVTATFAKGSGDIAWDVHSHDHSGGTKIHDKGASGSGTVNFTAPEDGVFSILWMNGGSASSPLEVSITLGEGASIHSWMPAE